MSFSRPPVIPAWAATGDKSSQPSDSDIQTGWPLSSVPPSRQKFNWLLNFLANGVRYLMTRGIADWNTGETYAVGALVIGDDGQLYRSLQNGNSGNMPSSSPTYWDLFQSTASLRAYGLIAATGDVKMSLVTQAGWIVRDGGTIGDASSGASNRANADTLALYSVLWALDATAFPIFTSSGSSSTRGASAAADFAAHKRIQLMDARGGVDRGVNLTGSGMDNGRILGSLQTQEAGIIKIETLTSGTGTPPQTINVPQDGTVSATFVTGDAVSASDQYMRVTTSTNMRMQNTAYYPLIKL